MTLLGSRRATYRAEAAPAKSAEPAAPGPTVPQQRQRQRQRRDAYTLYAEIYALRLDLDDPGEVDDH